MREETQTEVKKKKKGKEEEEVEGPHMIKYVQYSNLDLSKKNIPAYSKWIGSILQTIIVRNILDAFVRLFVVKVLISLDRRADLEEDISLEGWSSCVQSEWQVLGETVLYEEVDKGGD